MKINQSTLLFIFVAACSISKPDLPQGMNIDDYKMVKKLVHSDPNDCGVGKITKVEKCPENSQHTNSNICYRVHESKGYAYDVYKDSNDYRITNRILKSSEGELYIKSAAAHTNA